MKKTVNTLNGKLLYSCALLLVFLVSSCTSKMYTSIDVLRPAEIQFDKDARKLLILNNSVPQPSTYGHTVQLIDEKKKNSTLNTDSLALFCLSVVNEEFQKNGFFAETSVQLESTNKTANFFELKLPSADTLKYLANTYGADVILSLDRIKVTDKVQDFYNQQYNSYLANFEANYESVWSVYNPKNNSFYSKVFRDTIYWEKEAYQRKTALMALPDRYNALIDGALHVGQSSMKKFVPWWDKEDRYFFVANNKIMKTAMDSVAARKWDAAVSTWKSGLMKARPSAKVLLYHNIAVANEIMGNIDEAMQYCNMGVDMIEKAQMISPDNILTILLYKDKLENRAKEIEELNKQLGTD